MAVMSGLTGASSRRSATGGAAGSAGFSGLAARFSKPVGCSFCSGNGEVIITAVLNPTASAATTVPIPAKYIVYGEAIGFLSIVRREEQRAKVLDVPQTGIGTWEEVCKFLSGAFFVIAGILFYLWLTNTPMPIWGTSYVVSPEAHGWRLIAHVVFFAVGFYFGFVRK
jgi:hypothetical protein